MEYKDYFEKILLELSTGTYSAEIEEAKLEYFSMAGTIHKDNEQYPEWMRLFLDWYVYDRPLNNTDLTPLELYIEKHSSSSSDEDKIFFDSMLANISSIFFVNSVANNKLSVKDLFTGRNYIVEDKYISRFTNKGDVFNVRIIPFPHNNIFSGSYCFHNPDSIFYIKGEMKKIKNMGKSYLRDLIFRLAVMKLKSQEYPHLPISHIYNVKPKLRF